MVVSCERTLDRGVFGIKNRLHASRKSFTFFRRGTGLHSGVNLGDLVHLESEWLRDKSS